jgi:hypothetical protein
MTRFCAYRRLALFGIIGLWLAMGGESAAANSFAA